MYEKFGKSFRDVEGLKTSFFTENDKHLSRAQKYAALYLEQPRRERCKVCASPLPSVGDFLKLGVPYAVCTDCTHLNGLHEDSDAYCAAVYTSGAGADYAATYGSADREAYLTRRRAIYEPKAEFLFDALRREGCSPEQMSFADMGAGSGYFVSALRTIGATEVVGYEVGETQVALARWMNEPVTKSELHDIVELTRTAKADVLTFIGVFEHLQDLRGTLRALSENTQARFLYFCVPMFSATVFNEIAFPHVMPRHLAVGHTHLFTGQSIERMTREFSMSPVAAWWFGTDVMDYYRSIYVALHASATAASPELVADWQKRYGGLVDPLQLAIDERRESSQVHMVLRLR